MKLKNKRILSLLLAMVMGVFGHLTFSANVVNGQNSPEPIELEPLSTRIPVQENKLQIDGTVLEDDTYGHIRDYELKQGHTLSISSADHVFSVRQLVNGDYSAQLKVPATADAYSAASDMIVGVWVRRPDSGELAEGELSGIYIIDSIYGMVDVPGFVHRFTVDAETIDGGTHTTRAAIFLPENYSASGVATKLVIMTNGARGHLSDSVWNNGTADDIALMKNYMEAGYAVLVVDNTAGTVGGAQDWGNPQHIDSYWKAYEYVQANLNVEETFYLHSRSMGTMAATRIMRERPELVKCAIMCGAVSSLEACFINNPSFIARRFGFDDKTGATYEADKVIGYDTYTDIVGAAEYSLPPTFWMLSESDAHARTLGMIEDIASFGNDVRKKTYSGTDHSGVCRLNIEECWNDAIAYFEEYEESKTEHRFRAWNILKEATCSETGEMRRECADCQYYESVEISMLSGHVFDGGDTVCDICGKQFDIVRKEIALIPGHFSDSGAWVASDSYGCVIGYELKSGHTLSISNDNYVFSVRILKNGNYSTMLKPATVDSFTAEEDMTIAVRVRKPDKSAVTEAELEDIVLFDCYYVEHIHTYENGICTGCGAAQPGVVITQQPEDTSAERFAEVVVSVAAEGDGLTYAWYYRCAGETEFRASSCTGDTFNTVMSSDLHGCQVYCVITDSAGNSVTSETAVLTLAGEEAPETPPARIPGDINGDGVVNNKDLTRLFQYLSDYDVEIH